ncbi:MAG: hypothetical protein JWO85_327, partial [Candidatus Eremiobacteraeota bacterium]|nr:hypothetical protein [Candidatus Eremiobacteraeota bacterium]
PNIGRVRTLTPACASMRDLVIPSFAAARRADARFAETLKRLPMYAEVADDPEHRTDVFRESALAKLDSDATALLKETLVINRALGDPRLSKDSNDPAVLAERAELQRVYDAQSARANLLEEFVMRQRVAIAKNGIDDNHAFASRLNADTATPMAAPYAPDPTQTASPNMPPLNGNSMSDKRIMDEWARGISSGIRASENRAAKTFLSIAKSCTST